MFWVPGDVLTKKQCLIIQGMNYPPKGTITMHTICGADIKREKDESSSALDLLAEVFKQAEAIKKAYDDNKDDDDTDKPAE